MYLTDLTRPLFAFLSCYISLAPLLTRHLNLTFAGGHIILNLMFLLFRPTFRLINCSTNVWSNDITVSDQWLTTYLKLAEWHINHFSNKTNQPPKFLALHVAHTRCNRFSESSLYILLSKILQRFVFEIIRLYLLGVVCSNIRGVALFVVRVITSYFLQPIFISFFWHLKFTSSYSVTSSMITLSMHFKPLELG